MALVKMENFKSQVTVAVNELLEKDGIHVCLLPPNTTDRLQPLEKNFIRQQFEKWYSEQLFEQFEEMDAELGDKINPQFITNGFRHTGIS